MGCAGPGHLVTVSSSTPLGGSRVTRREESGPGLLGAEALVPCNGQHNPAVTHPRQVRDCHDPSDTVSVTAVTDTASVTAATAVFRSEVTHPPRLPFGRAPRSLVGRLS